MEKNIGFTAVGGEKQGHGSGMLSCTLSGILPCRTHRHREHTPYAISLFSVKKYKRWIPSERFSPPFHAPVPHRAALLTAGQCWLQPREPNTSPALGNCSAWILPSSFLTFHNFGSGRTEAAPWVAYWKQHSLVFASPGGNRLKNTSNPSE